jgi:hypothetical protein
MLQNFANAGQNYRSGFRHMIQKNSIRHVKTVSMAFYSVYLPTSGGERVIGLPRDFCILQAERQHRLAFYRVEPPV